jgi:uncharacterized protein YxjI
MRLAMRERMVSWGDDYYVRDAHGRDVYYIDGKVFSLRQTLIVRDMAGVELASIRRRLLAWGPTFEIERGGKVVAEVRKHLFTLFRMRFTVDVPGPDDLEAEGDFLQHEYRFLRGGAAVAHVSKRWFSLADTYGIDYDDAIDPVMLVASAVVIDQCLESGGSSDD